MNLEEKQDALLEQLSRSRKAAKHGEKVIVEPTKSKEKERTYGWYPPADGEHFKSQNQAKLDMRVYEPNEWRAKQVIPEDLVREPISTQVGADGIAPCVPPFATDPMAYKYSIENSEHVPIAKAEVDFDKWHKEEAGKIPEWNSVVRFHREFTEIPKSRPVTVDAIVNEAEKLVTAPTFKRSLTMNAMKSTRKFSPKDKTPIGELSESPVPIEQEEQGQEQEQPQQQQQELRVGSGKSGMRAMATTTTEVIPPPGPSQRFSPQQQQLRQLGKVPSPINRQVTMAAPPMKGQNLSLREIQDIQKKLSKEYRWRYDIHGDPLAVKVFPF